MPGLWGYWTENEASPLGGLASAMAVSMRHHPGLKAENREYRGFVAGRIHLGYLQDESQPAEDATGRFSLWLDGEFNNEPDLLRFYDLSQGNFRDQAHLALTLYLKVGWAFLREVDGLFNLALYDRDLHQLTLANDRYGLRPLYWTKTTCGFSYAGEVKALLNSLQSPLRIDPVAVNEWFTFGYLLDKRTWIEGIELYPAATIMKVSPEGLTITQYCSWHNIEPFSGKVDEQQVAEELVRLWNRAVTRRVDRKRLGQFLSGGLDSRAILAALPTTEFPYNVLTFGSENCDDAAIARRVAQRKGVRHHVVVLTSDNWLPLRLDALWWTDGMGRVLDLHGIEAASLFSKICNVHLHGFLGDATIGGSYLGSSDPSSYLIQKMYIHSPLGLEKDAAVNYLLELYGKYRCPLDRFLITQRGRRFINTGLIMMSAFLEARLPFFDKEFLSYALSIPENMRRESQIYNKMLVHGFSAYYRDIPWQKTGLPITAMKWAHAFLRARNVLGQGIGRVGRSMGFSLGQDHRGYADYPTWLRTEPALGFVNRMLLKGDPIYATFLDWKKVRTLVLEFIDTKDNRNLVTIGLLLGFEIYLNQLFNPSCLKKLFNDKQLSGE